MSRLHDNYYQRKYYLEKDEVPTQTVMKKKMQLPLANVYFNSMTPKVKVLAGLEPPMKGGGADWWMPPDEFLIAGRAVLKPINHDLMKLMGCDGLDLIGQKIFQKHFKIMHEIECRAIRENDLKSKRALKVSNRVHRESTARAEALGNTATIRHAFMEFEVLYRKCTTMIEKILIDASIKEIQSAKEETYQQMNLNYKTLLKHQEEMLSNMYKNMLALEKDRLKNEFISYVEEIRMDMGKQIHDINLEKHTAIKKLRSFLECQHLACQIYVGLKEREVCKKEIELSEKEYRKKIKHMKEEIAMKDFNIHREIQEENKRKEYNRVWRKKICHVVKKFQLFVKYALKTLPQHAEFFTNMEKLMLLQINEASENPNADSIIQTEERRLTPEPHPFFLCCDRGYHPLIDRNLCPKHCTSSASQLPVVVVNKKMIYAACDTFEMFSDKVRQYVGGQRGAASGMEDDLDYNLGVPVKFTSKTDIQELKLESSLMQVLQQELANIRLPLECPKCKMIHCFCYLKDPVSTQPKTEEPVPSKQKPSGLKIPEIQAKEVLKLQREPKWESYMDFIIPNQCECGKRAKKYLKENLPPYMQKMSPYAEPELPNYVPCPVFKLKELVKEAKGVRTPPALPEDPSNRRADVGTQYSDEEFNFLCTCFSDDEINNLKSMKCSKLFDLEKTKTKKPVVDGSMSVSLLRQTASSFATARANSLRRLIGDNRELLEMFKSEQCDINSYN